MTNFLLWIVKMNPCSLTTLWKQGQNPQGMLERKQKKCYKQTIFSFVLKFILINFGRIYFLESILQLKNN